jgi:2-C-methyl-D-erythritol 4-phosphate cytidylyltransferase
LLAWTLDAFERCVAVDRIALVVAADAIERTEALVRDEGFAKITHIVAGGATRQASVHAGLEAVAGCEWVAVHDGARPFVTPELIEATLGAAHETGAACCAVPAHDTLKEVADGHIVRTLDRSRLWLAQTPQAFRYELLLEAHQRSEGGATDDATLVEALGVEVRVVPGSARNFKVTTADDLALAEALLS